MKKRKGKYVCPKCAIYRVGFEAPLCTSVYHRIPASFEPKNNTFFEENEYDVHSYDTKWERDEIESGTIDF